MFPCVKWGRRCQNMWICVSIWEREFPSILKCHMKHHIQCHVGATSTRHYCPWKYGRHKCVTTCGSSKNKTMCFKTCNLKKIKMHKVFCTPNMAPLILTLVHLRSWRPKWMCNPCLKVVVSHLFAIPVLSHLGNKIRVEWQTDGGEDCWKEIYKSVQDR